MIIWGRDRGSAGAVTISIVVRLLFPFLDLLGVQPPVTSSGFNPFLPRVYLMFPLVFPSRFPSPIPRVHPFDRTSCLPRVRLMYTSFSSHVFLVVTSHFPHGLW